MSDLQLDVLNDFALRQERAPEAVSVLVVGNLDGLLIHETVARSVAPLVAAKLYPKRAFGDVLHIERDLDGNWLVDVEALAISYLGGGFYRD